MIKFTNLNTQKPFAKFKEAYEKALSNKQIGIEALSISSFNKTNNEVESRFVNIKVINNDNFIFFTNYRSPKSYSFESHKQVSALFYWPSINTQIRMKAKIKKTSIKFNNLYFKNRSIEKNALAISSNQSQPISDFNEIIKHYENVKKTNDLKKCPEYWGGYSFRPYEIEFWEGNEYRLNKRNLYRKDNANWEHFILQP